VLMNLPLAGVQTANGSRRGGREAP
jgi:hypothetical protein